MTVGTPRRHGRPSNEAQRHRAYAGPLTVFALGSLFLVWRSTLGFDLRDGSYVIALSQRLSRGEVPFVDEISPHILGSALMAPTTHLWGVMVGSAGIVVVARLSYTLLAVVVAVVAWRALSPSFGRTSSALAVWAAVLALPYNIQAISYNTVPQLGLMLSTAAATAAVLRFHRGWAALASVTAAGASLAYFVVLPAAVALLLGAIQAQVLLRPTGVRRWSPVITAYLIAPGMLVGLMFLVWVTFVPGWAAVWDAFQAQSGRPGGIGFAPFYWHFIAGAKLLPIALMLALAGTFFRRPVWLRPFLLAAAGVALAMWAGEHGPPEIEPSQGRYAGALALVVVAVMGFPLMAWLWWRGSDAGLRVLSIIALPSGLLGMLITSAVTMSGAAYGAYAVPLGGLVLLTCLLTINASRALRASLSVSLLPAVVLNLAFAASLVAVIFNEGAFVHLDRRITEGPGAGLLVGEANDRNYQAVAALMQECPETASGFLSVWVPGAYLWWDRENSAPQYWLGPVETKAGYDYITQSGLRFDCVLAPSSLEGPDIPAGLRRELDSEYEPVTVRTLTGVAGDAAAQFSLFVRRGMADGT